MKVVLYRPSLIRKGVDIKAIYSSTTGKFVIGTDFQQEPDGGIVYVAGSEVFWLRAGERINEVKSPIEEIYSPRPDEKLYVALTDVWVDIFSDLSCIGEFGGDEVISMGQITNIVDEYEIRMRAYEKEKEAMQNIEREVRNKYLGSVVKQKSLLSEDGIE